MGGVEGRGGEKHTLSFLELEKGAKYQDDKWQNNEKGTDKQGNR